MRYYCWAWRSCWAVLALLLVVASMLIGSAGAVLGTGVSAGLLGAVAAAVLLQNGAGTRVPVSRHERVAARCGLRVGAVAGVLGAWTAVVDSPALPLLVVAALSSPPAVGLLLGGGRYRRSRGAVLDGTGCRCGCAEPVSAEEMRVLLMLLSDAELVRSWRHSLERLRRARSATEWSGLVALRTACLAELEDRDPPAVRRWLASRPTAATAPDLSRPSTGPVLPVAPPPEA